MNPHQQPAQQRNKHWIGLLPWLLLGHVLIHDEVYSLYQDKDRFEGHAGTDGRNSDWRPKQWFEKAEEVYNDEKIIFETLLLPQLHSDFRQSYRLDGTNTPKTNAETIKKKAATVCAEILCTIDKWERSGNASGQRAEDEQGFGSIRRENDQLWLVPDTTIQEPEFQDGDNRANFLGGKESHILCLWELFDQHQMLQTTIACLPSDVGSDGGNVPRARGRPKKTANQEAREKEKDKVYQRNQEKIGNSLESIAQATLNENHAAYCKQVRRARRELCDCDDEEEREELQRDLEILKGCCDAVLRQIKELKKAKEQSATISRPSSRNSTCGD